MGVYRVAWQGVAAAILLALVGISSAHPSSAIEACFSAAAAISAEASRALDGATIELRDGRVVRLAGIIAPGTSEGDAEVARRSTGALDALVSGKSVRLHFTRNDQDRYGRVVAQLTVPGAPVPWVQAALVTAGHARVLPGSGDPDCSQRLLVFERLARDRSRGLWGDPAFAVLKANSIPGAAVLDGRFVLVEAAVRRVGEAGGRLFLDFGRRFTEDFTIVIPRDAQTAFTAAGVDLRSLSGKWVRARGVLFSWGGPAIELRVPGALELIEADEG